MNARSLSSETSDNDVTDIAVIGMAGRFPGARNLSEFWSNVSSGVESIRPLTSAELDAAGVPAAVRETPGYVAASSRLDDADCFDAALFGYSPREAALMDPQSRVCLELAWHALEDAGYSPLDMQVPVGVFATASLCTYLLQNLNGQLDPQDFVLGLGNIPIVLGNGPDFIATRVSYKLNLRGPAVAVQTACSSSLTAIHLARQSILNGECDVALAGGVSIYLPQNRGYLYQDGMILSADGHCRPFDADADGIVFGRGGGIVVLKALDRAIADGDRIRAVIRGSAANNDGSRKVGFAAPSVTGQSRVIAEALADAGLRADAISYVEAHGTGTKVGDPIEIAALTEAYRKHTRRTGYCAIGTVKANIGHLDVAAGVTGFIKTVLMLEHRQIPASLNFRRPNPAIDFASSPFYVNTTLRPWEAGGGPRRAGVSAFGIGGTNVHVIVEEGAPATSDARRDVRPMEVLRLTARTDDALGALCGSVGAALRRDDAPEIADVCHTANTGRAHLVHRVVVRGSSSTEIGDALQAAAAGELDPRVVRGQVTSTDAPPVAFLFPGLGAQSAGMGKALYDTQPVFRAALNECDALLRPHLPRPLLSVLYPPAGETSPIEETTYGQPITFAFSYALAMLWRSWGVRPAAAIGHSLGEYVAACVAGLLPLHEALRLVATRARLADTLPPGGGMTAVFASEAQVRAAMGADADQVAIASLSGPESLVLSGPADAVARVADRLAARNVEVRALKVSQAFHSRLLDPILDEYERAVAKTTFGRLEFPVISNVTGRVMTEADGNTPAYWRRHAREAVRFADGIQALYDRGIRHFLEIGPHTTAIAMASGCISDESACFLPSLRRGRDDYDQLLETVSELYVRGISVDWTAIGAPSGGRRVALPLYPFERARHWIEPAAASRATPAASVVDSRHPMLGARLSSPLIPMTTPAFAVTVDPAAQPFLNDHRVFGARVFPATAYLEVAFEAADATGRRMAAVENLEIPAALRLGDRPGEAQIVLSSEGDAFEIFARDDAGAKWTKHATGRLDAGSKLPKTAVDGVAVRARCTNTTSGHDFYAGLAAQGFEYGPLFRGIKSLRLGNGEVCADIALPPSLEAEAARFAFHPALLDACLQISFALVPAGRTFLPVRIDRVEVSTWRSKLFAHAVRRSAAADARTFVCDVTISDERGVVVGEATGILLQDASAAQRAGQRPEWERWLYEPTWQVAPLPNARPAASRNWLMVDEASKFSAAEHYTRAIDRATSKAPLDGVVYLAGAVQDPVASDASVASLLALVQALGTHAAASSARLWIVTSGAQGVVAGDTVPGVFAAPLWGLAGVVQLEHPEMRCSCLDLDPREANSDAALWAEINGDTNESRVALRGGARYISRLARVPAGELGQATSPQRRRLESAEPGVLDSLGYVNEPRRVPAAGEVEIEVRSSGLNFKDVLTALGRFPRPASGLGHECAGVVVAVGPGVTGVATGDEVLAFVPGSLSTHVLADVRMVAPKPAAISFEQAATIAGGFLTAHHALNDLAQIGPGDRVLIHAATGGVGLAAVQIATRAGATIFATAGTDAKRARLTSLGVEHVFNSRTADFAAKIRQRTGGRGVSVVLNSLTGDVLDESAAILEAGGRFVELGRSADGGTKASALLPAGAKYFAPDVAGECAADPNRFGRALRALVAAIDRGELTPLPVEAFDAADASAAFRLMARAGHIGKLAVRQRPAADTPRIIADATYVVVGALGGLGLLVAERLVDRGARHLALMARRDPGQQEIAAIDALRVRGANVLLVRADVSVRADVDAAMRRILAECPPIRGVVQAAGVLDDGVLLQQTPERFARVMAPKVAGSWNLHEALQLRGQHLDFFVMFSSVASLLGSQGQANHAAANAFLDALSAYRRGRGLAALSINWGAWGSVGAAATRKVGALIATRGLGEMAPESALAAFDEVLFSTRTQIGASPVDWQLFGQQFADGQAPRCFSDLLPKPQAPVRDARPANRRALINRLVREQVAKGLGLEPATIDADKPLAAMGLDSLLAVELRNALTRGLGLTQRLPATLLFDYPSIAALTDHLLSATATAAETDEQKTAPLAPPSSRPGVDAPELRNLQARIEELEARERARREPIAVIGLGCRFPGDANSPSAFWRLLSDGVDAIGDMPADRWDVSRGYDIDPEAPGKFATRFGGFLKGIDQFDPHAFGITPREAETMDPQQRVLLEVAWEALQHAGYAPDRLAGSLTGVFVGIGTNDYFNLYSKQGALSDIDAYLATGNAHSVASGRISYLLGLQGPSLSVDTACSASLVAVHTACESIRAGSCDAALAGGVGILLSQENYVSLSKARMMAPDGRCKTFDARADGFVRAEGCGVVLLKRLRDAERDGDRVLAVIRGTACNQDGRSNGLTAPNGPAQQAVIRAALTNAGVSGRDVSYVETHGTGTVLGDPIEVESLTAVLGPGRTASDRLLLGSVKTNLGHLEASAGVAGLIKAVLALHHREIPANLNFRTPNPHINWDQHPYLSVPTATTRWESNGASRFAGVSAFGFSGTNVHVVLEEAPATSSAATSDERPVHLLAISGKTDDAMRRAATELVAHIERTNPTLADLCFSVNTSRATLEHRAIVRASTLSELRMRLRNLAANTRDTGVRTGVVAAGAAPRMVWNFPDGTDLREATELAARWTHWGVAPDAVMAEGTGLEVAAQVAPQVPAYSEADGASVVLEIGGHDSRTWDGIAASVAELFVSGIAIDWRGFDRGFTRTRVDVPAAPWTRERYWFTARHESPASAAAPAPVRTTPPSPPVAVTARADSTLRDRLIALTPGERKDILNELVRKQVVRVMRLRPGTPPPGVNDRLMSIGMDSLMAVELQKNLHKELESAVRLPSTLIFDHPTIAAISDLLATLFGFERAAAPREPMPARPTADRAAADIAELSDDEVEELLNVRLKGLA